MSSIILIGAQHVGKSTVGKMLSHRLHIPLIDTDALILAQSPQYKSIRTLYNAIGKNEFHTLEYQVCNTISAPCILATGGGIAENTLALETLQQYTPPQYLKILLTAPPDVVWSRIISRGIPAYLDATLSTMPIHTIPQKDIDEMKEKFIPLFTKKQNIYTSIANYSVSSSKKDTVKNTAQNTVNSTLKTIGDITDEIIAYITSLDSNKAIFDE